MNISSIISSLGALSKKWLSPNDLFRRKAIRRLVQKNGFAPKAAELMLDALFSELTASRLRALVRAEVGDARVLDGAARGPGSITHVLSGNVPNPGVQSLVHGLLVKSLNRVKPSSRDEGIVDLYLASLRAHNRKLAASCELLSPSDRGALRRAITSSNLIVAYGSDESVAAVRAMAGPRRAFVGYGHRVSFSLYTRGGMGRGLAPKTALDSWMMDRRGCLSPALVFVEDSKRIKTFCTDVWRALSKLEASEGAVRTSVERSAAIRALSHESRLQNDLIFAVTPKGRYFVRAARQGALRWNSLPGVDIRFFQRRSDVYKSLEPFSGVLQAVALECALGERKSMADKLARLGFNRICRAGELQFPPVTWRHDGRPNFSDWLNQAPF